MDTENLEKTTLNNNEPQDTSLRKDEEKQVEKKNSPVVDFFHRTRRSIKTASLKEKLNNSTYRFRNGNLKKYKKYFFPVLGIIILILVFYLGKSFNTGNINQDTRPLPAVTLAKQEINKNFNFPLKDAAGKKVGKLTYKLETAELQDSIIVKGQRARAVKGRIFLILNIKIVNDNSQGVQINSKDYVRLSVNGKDEWIAADIHNDPVEVQAISTKITRLGFPINDTDKNIRLQIGEIEGTKETVNINFNNK